MFDSLQQSLAGALKTLTGKGKLTEANMREGLALVQQALLEADVSYSVVKDFMARVTEQAVGEKVLSSLNPSQQLVGIVHQQLIDLMGPVDSSMHLKPELTVLMMCGLQGSGKTTTCGKLARHDQRARPHAADGRRRLAAPGGDPPVARHRRAVGRAGLFRGGGDRSGGASASTRSSRPKRAGPRSSSSTPPAGCTSTTS